MYRLMKSEKYALFSPMHGNQSFFRQIEIEHYTVFDAALTACEHRNEESLLRHYILDDSGKEYYQGSWID